MFRSIGQAVKDLPWMEISTAFAAGAALAAGVLAGRKILKVTRAAYKAAAEEAAEKAAS